MAEQQPAPTEPAKPWYRSKTIWAAITAIVTAVGAWLGGEMSGPQALQMVFAGLGAIFLRDAIAKDSGRGASSLLLLLLPLALMAGCESPGARAEHASYGVYLRRVAPKLGAYLAADQKLSDEERQDWKDFEDTSKSVWEAREGALNPKKEAK